MKHNIIVLFVPIDKSGCILSTGIYKNNSQAAPRQVNKPITKNKQQIRHYTSFLYQITLYVKYDKLAIVQGASRIRPKVAGVTCDP